MQEYGTQNDPIELSSDEEDASRGRIASSRQQSLNSTSTQSVAGRSDFTLSNTISHDVYSHHERVPRLDAKQLDSLTHNNIVLQAGTDIKYADSQSELSAQPKFFHIKWITRDGHGTVCLHGWDMRQNIKHQQMFLGTDANQSKELHIIAELPLRYVDTNVATTSLLACIELPAICSVIKIIFSNVLGPVEDVERYICRWIHIDQKYHDRRDQFILKRLRAEDCPDSNWTIPDHVLRSKHRQPAGTDHVDRSGSKRCTNISVCCGCGGDMTGAAKAGWLTCIGIEKDADAVKTLQAQQAFIDVRIEDVPLGEYLSYEDGDYSLVDHIWLSFPCQWCSPANRGGGPRDDENLAVSFATFELIKRHRPRVVSVEQSYGLNDERFAGIKAMFIRQFTDLGYSITYSTIDLRHFGIPLPRRRVIMIATCPGEKIIPMPKITHSKEGSKAFVTPEEHLATIDARRFASHLHKTIGGPHGLRDKNSRLGCAIASGPLPTHPNGRRRLILWEFAALQTFGPEHVWPNDLKPEIIKKQIGNAVPPMYAELHFRHLEDHLRAEDKRIKQLLRTQS